jgi:hypothetical protein
MYLQEAPVALIETLFSSSKPTVHTLFFTPTTGVLLFVVLSLSQPGKIPFFTVGRDGAAQPCKAPYLAFPVHARGCSITPLQVAVLVLCVLRTPSFITPHMEFLT